MTRTIPILLVCGLAVLALTACQPAADAGPQGVFDRMKAAVKANDMSGLVTCIEPKAQKLIGSQMLMSACMVAVGGGPEEVEAFRTRMKPLGVNIDNVVAEVVLMKASGGSPEDLQALQDEAQSALATATDVPAVVKASLGYIEEKSGGKFGEIMSAAFSQARTASEGATLANVVVTGTTATGTVSPSGETVKFIKVGEQWYLAGPDVPDKPAPPPPPDDAGWQTDLHIVARWWHATLLLGEVEQQLMKWHIDGMSGQELAQTIRDMADTSYEGLVKAYRVGDELGADVAALRRIHPEMKERWIAQMESMQSLIIVFEDVRDGAYDGQTEIPDTVKKAISKARLDAVLYREWLEQTRAEFEFPPQAVLDKKIAELFGPQDNSGAGAGDGDTDGSGGTGESAPDNAGGGSGE